jgi:hypothetical protein
VSAVVFASRGIIPLDAQPAARRAGNFTDVADSARRAIVGDPLADVVAVAHFECMNKLFKRMNSDHKD